MRFFKNLHNELDFFLRSHIRFSREYHGQNEPKDDLFTDYPQEVQEKEALYLEKYHLEELKNNSTKRNYLENLDVIEILESFINVDKPEAKILDIGSKNFYYAAGEYNFFKYNGFEREIRLDGVEIDAYRMYVDFHTRCDYARYYTKNLSNCRYIPTDLMKHEGKYDYITWFFPFVTEVPLIAWGLPLRQLKPLKLLEHAVSLLKPGGVMLIVNQEKKEYLVQERLLKELNLDYELKGIFSNNFFDIDYDKYVIIVTK